MFNVMWELLDGNTQEESETYFDTIEEAIAYLTAMALQLNGQFNWIQIENSDALNRLDEDA